jgi:tetratricopeptide (TPR) repeat protein
LKIKPDYHEVWASRGIALYDLGRYREAIASYDQSLKLRPEHHDTWYNRGNALVRLGRDQEAIDSYGRAVKLKPDYHEAWFNQGNALSRLSRYQEAIGSYDRAIQGKANKYEAWTNRGIAFDRLGQHAKAVASYDRALKIKPDYHEAWYNRGNAMDWLEAIRAGRPANDESWLDETLQLLTEVAEAGHVDFVRQIIDKSDLGERFFPLTRALDYLESGNDALIEKLSPEVRDIVKEVADKLVSAMNMSGTLNKRLANSAKPPAGG